MALIGVLAKERFMDSEIRKIIGLAVGAVALIAIGILGSWSLTFFYDELWIVLTPLLVAFLSTSMFLFYGARN